MRDDMTMGKKFKQSDYGTPIASNTGKPPAELKAEMKIKYGLVDTDPDDKTDKKDRPEAKKQADLSNIKPMDGMDLDISKQIKQLGHDINNNDS